MNVRFAALAFLIFLIPFGQILRFSFPGAPEAYVHFTDIVALFILIHSIMFFNEYRRRLPAAGMYLILLIVVMLCSLLVNISTVTNPEMVIGSMYLVRFATYSSVYFAAYKLSAGLKIKTVNYLFLAGVAVAILGLVQYFLYPNLRNLEYAGWDPHENRVFGTFFDSGFTAAILSLTLILALYYVKSATQKKLRIFLFILTAFVYAAFILTYARSAYISFIAAMAALTTVSKTWKPLVITVAIIGITLILIPRNVGTSEATKLSRTASGSARIDNFYETLTLISEKPVFGWGFNTLRYIRRDKGISGADWQVNHADSGADSSLLFTAATTGIIGLTVLLSFFGKIFILASKKNGFSAEVIIPSLVLIIVNSMFLNSFYYPFILIWLFILLGAMDSPDDFRFIAGPVT